MKPLNLRNYMFLSLKEITPQIGLLGIKIALFIFLCSIGTAVVYGMNKHTMGLTEKYVSISINPSVDEEQKSALLEKVKGMEGVERLLPGNAVPSGVGKLILFNTVCWNFEVDKSEIGYILSSLKGKVIEGELPRSPGELLISRELSISLEKNIGDYVGSDEMLHRKYKISGIYEGSNSSYISYAEERQYTNNYIIRLKPGAADEVYSELGSLDNQITLTADREELRDMISNIIGLLSIVGGIILLITAVDVTVSVSNLNKVYFTDRASEFAILQAVGYTKSFVRRRLIKELSILTSSGLALGLALGQLVITVFYYMYCEVRGIPFSIFNPTLMMLACILVVVIYLLSYIPVRRYIDKMDWVEALQR
jgi:cell division protein FtsX